LAFSISPRSSNCGVLVVLTVSTTVARGDETYVWGGKSETSALGELFRPITMGMTGLGVTVRLLPDCSRGVVVASDVGVDVPPVL
jgi:hypothetical protein